MPVINIEYDNSKVSESEAQLLAEGAHKVVSTVTQIEDVPVYANSSQIKVAVSPIEIFIRLSDHKIEDADDLMSDLKHAFSEWKTEQNFQHPLNISLIPMGWKIEFDI